VKGASHSFSFVTTQIHKVWDPHFTRNSGQAGLDSDEGEEYLPNLATTWEVTQRLDDERRQCSFVKGAVEAWDPASGTDFQKIIEEIKERFSKTS